MTTSKELVSGLYSLAKLMRMGNYFLRLVLAIKPVLEMKLVISYAPPPPSALQLQALLRKFLWPYAGKHKGPPTERQQRERRAREEEMALLFNGNPYGPLTHHCESSKSASQSGHCVQGLGKRAFRCLACNEGVRSFLVSLPCRASKWFQMLPRKPQ